MNDLLKQLLQPLTKGDKPDWEGFLKSIGSKSSSPAPTPTDADAGASSGARAGTGTAAAPPAWPDKIRDFINSFFK